MSRLNQVLEEQNKVSQKKVDKKDFVLPTYNEEGKVVREGVELVKKRIAICLFVLSFLILFIYLPQAFMRDKVVNNQPTRVNVDASAIKAQTDYYSKHLEDDYDNDTMSNSAEDKYFSNPWDIDTDHDGADDYYEVYISKTSPYEYDREILVDYQKMIDEENDNTLSTPFKINGVVLWASDYAAKARGTVVATPKGYHFSSFTGYAQFPHSSKIYAYAVENGKYRKLNHLNDEDAWEIDCENVEIYDKPLEEVVECSLFFKKKTFQANMFTKFLSIILPNKGLVTAQKKVSKDILPNTDKIHMANNHTFNYDKTDGTRFAKNMIQLSDLQFVRSMIDKDLCVMVSLYDPANGEFIGIVYGYDDYNNLYVTDEKGENVVGTISVTEKTDKLLTVDGMRLYSSYEWEGLGFKSKNYHRINFFAVATTLENETDDKQIILDEYTDMVNEATSETTVAPTSVTTEAVTENNTQTTSNVSDSQTPVTETTEPTTAQEQSTEQISETTTVPTTEITTTNSQ